MMSAESISEKSVSYQKKDGHVFWYENDKDLKVFFLVTRVMSLQARTKPEWKQLRFIWNLIESIYIKVTALIKGKVIA